MHENDNTHKKKRIKRKLLAFAFSLIFIAVMSYCAFALISGRQLRMPLLDRFFSSGIPEINVNEYHFNVGRNIVVADLGGFVAAAGSFGVQVFDSAGNETFRDHFRMSFPMIEAQNGTAIAYDIEGTAVRILNSSGVISEFETEGPIVSASINQNGWFLVCTQEGGGFRGTVRVYNSNGDYVYRVDLASGFIHAAALSHDNKNLAILSLTESGNRILFYSLDSVEPSNHFFLSIGLILEIKYLPGGDLLAISTDALFIISGRGIGRELYAFPDRRLGGYAFGDEFVALHLLDYGVGHSGSLISIDTDGRVIGEVPSQREIISLSASGDALAALMGDGPVLFDAQLEDVQISGSTVSTAGANRILSIGGGTAIAYGDHIALVVR